MKGKDTLVQNFITLYLSRILPRCQSLPLVIPSDANRCPKTCFLCIRTLLPFSRTFSCSSLPLTFAHTFSKLDFVKKNLERHKKVSQYITT